jgi:GAF domain-containing protein
MPRETLLVRTLVELADNLVDDFDVMDLLTVLADRCVAVLEVSAAGVMLAAPDGGLQVAASSSVAMRTLELFELQANEGPCVDCYASGEPIVNLELSSAGRRWPRFAARARAEGFRTVHALPMRLRGRNVGALNMFRSEEGGLDDADVRVAQALADVATIAILQHQRVIDARVLNDQLSGALQSRILIEQAKGRISEAIGVDVDEAFRRLRQHARGHNIRLADLSRDIVDGIVDPRALALRSGRAGR